MSRRHLITGGAGYLGARLADALLARGDEVVCFDLRPSQEVPPGATFVAGDVRDVEALCVAARDCEIVHHLVGIMPQARASESLMHAVNVGGTLNALEAARQNGVRRLIFASSSEVYGEPQTDPIAETHPCVPLGAYGRNKVEAEALCHQYAKKRLVETVMMRPSTLVGAAITERLFQQFLALAAQDKPLVYNWPGKTRFQMTGVHDCVAAFVLAVDANGINGEAFNLGAEGTLPMKEQILELKHRTGIRSAVIPLPVFIIRPLLRLLDVFGVSPLEKDHYQLMDRDIVMDCSKAWHMLGWKPTQTNVDMIVEAFDWARNKRVGTKTQGVV